ncbi:MAG TPA: alpha/beta hydrolase [Thermomicrobiales bacterium]|nr:alpha/beta hydrolase [Thermomicrobiales bacterium]
MSESTQLAAPVATNGRRSRARLQSVRRTYMVGDLRMSVLDWMGPEQPLSPPVVLLHGALQSSEGMANLASHLARRGRVIVPDLRGRGATGQPEDGYDPKTMAADVAGLIAEMGVDRPVVIGRLHGGLVAWHLASNHPEAVSGLIIGDTAPEVTNGHAKRLIEMTRLLPRSFRTIDDAYAFYQHTLGLPLERALHDIPFDLRRSRDGFTWRHNLDLVARIEEAALPRADWDVLAKIAVPTLVLRGQRGSLSPEMAERMCELIGDCTVQTILSSGRDVFLGGGAEQAFAAIDLFLLRFTDTGPIRDVAVPDTLARSYIEPLVRGLNGKDAAALRSMLTRDAVVEVVRDSQPVHKGSAETVNELMQTLLEQHPSAVFAVERFLASRREAAVRLVSRSQPAGDGARDEEVSLYLDLWIEIDREGITFARLQLARVPDGEG